MQQLPKPILGEVTAITIASPDLDASLAFYEQLGFSLFMRNDWPFPWIQVTDGALLMMVRKDPKPYIALTYYVKALDAVVKDLEAKGIKFDQKAKKTDMVKRYLFRSPDGLNISLVGMIDGFKQPDGKGMLHMDPKDYFSPEKYGNKTAGMYGEFAHPVADLDTSIAFWEKLGYKALSKFTSPYPWAILSDGLGVVGLHQTDTFDYPAITFFAADMPAKIAALKKAGLKKMTAKGAGNSVVTTPEGQHINLFALGGMGGGTETKKKEIKQTVLETERLLLKEVSPEILDEVFTTMTDDEIIKFLGLSGTEELATDRRKWEGGYTTYLISMKQFLLEDKSTGQIIGKGGFHNWYAEHNRSEIGYMMTDESAKNKGYMKEALKAMLDYGFEQMGLQRIEAFIGTANEPSQKLVKRYGFKKEGVLRSHFFKNGKLEDSVCFGLLKDEYMG